MLTVFRKGEIVLHTISNPEDLLDLKWVSLDLRFLIYKVRDGLHFVRYYVTWGCVPSINDIKIIVSQVSVDSGPQYKRQKATGRGAITKTPEERPEVGVLSGCWSAWRKTVSWCSSHETPPGKRGGWRLEKGSCVLLPTRYRCGHSGRWDSQARVRAKSVIPRCLHF